MAAWLCFVRRRWVSNFAIVMAAMFVSSAAGAHSWKFQEVAGPSSRELHAMAFDSNRGVTVLFGGTHDGPRRDTWEWDGHTWTRRATNGPSARFAHAMAYDSRRKVVVLFGGNDDHHDLGDTWEWDGDHWQRVAQNDGSGPPTRQGHAMAYDRKRKCVVLFGGVDHADNLLDNDTWMWNGTAWSKATDSGPSSRYGHAMAFDSVRNRVVLFGGMAKKTLGLITTKEPQHDTWEWNGSLWQRTSTDGPSSRYQHAMAFDSRRGKVVLFGGRDDDQNLEDDTWEYNGSYWSRKATSGPSDRRRHAIAYDSVRKRTVLFGGNSGSLRRDTWEW